MEHIPALGPLPRILRILSTSSSSSAATLGLLKILNPISANSSCVEALSKLECIGPIATAIRLHPEHTTIGLETLEKIISSSIGTEELVHQSIQVDLVPQLLKMLEESAHPHLTPSGRALIVSILKTLAGSRLNGSRVSAQLDQSLCWASYRDQRHDLFLQASGSALPIAAAAGVAGYLTQNRSEAAGLPRHHQPPPPLPTDPLQSSDQISNKIK